MATNGTKPPGSADKALGEIVTDVTSKATLLVKEEIELAKAEITTKVSRLAKGGIFFAIAGVLGLFALIWFFHFLALGIADWFGLKDWVGYAMTCVQLLIGAAILGFVAMRMFKKGSPPVPTMAIDEAKKTRAAIEEARR
jgi:uncharacterized membrane protein YqjE